MSVNKKSDFMKELSDALSGNVSPDKLHDMISYYDRYFADEIRNGKSEEEICRALGSPRLIAKSIIESEASVNGGQKIYSQPYGSSQYKNKKNRGDGTGKGWHVNVDETGRPSVAFGKLDFSSVWGKAVIALILVLIFCLIIGLIYVGVKILLYFVLPVALILLVVNIIISFISKK